MYPQVFGKYVLERELARGGMARVVLATLRGAGGFEKKLVVKQIRDELASDDDFVRRFVLEAKTTVQLAHPNIVPVYELGVELGTYFLAMEFVEGASLAELLRANPAPGANAGPAPGASANVGSDANPSAAPGASGRVRLSPEEGAYVGVEVCRALDYAHRRMNVVHRDVTPRNVMVDEEGQIKVIDFGIAAPVATAPSGHGVFGSPGHMPPEQMDAKELTPAADVFAVAVLLMELWTGRAPFRRRTREDIEAAMRAPHPRPSETDPRLLPLDDVIASAMSLDPAARPQQADDLGRALRKFLSGVDLGDLARHLGDRVRDLRLHPPPPPSEQRLILQRPPSRPTATQIGTKTFAARDEVREGARDEDVMRAAPLLVDLPEVSTRRIESKPPDGPSRSVRPPPAAGAPIRPREVETVAMTPLEATPRREASSPRRGLALLGTAGAGVLVIGAFFLGRSGTSAAPVAAPAPRTSVESSEPRVTAVDAAPPPAVHEAPALASAAAAAAVVAPAPAATVVAAAAPAAGAPSSSPAQRAQLVLLGDGTRVSIDGVERGACPTRAAIEPGTHSIVFSFPPTGESKGESLTLRAGDHATLHADFTGATPSIRTQTH